MKTIVILPTYNEAENIRPMAHAILEAVPDIHILVVDDNSPDGTGDIAEKMAREKPGQIHVLHRNKKEGLGKAYLDAFEYLLKSDVEQIIHMDADFSHPPALLPQFIAALKDFDFVLGSRYVPGGGTQNWSLKRRVMSRMANFYAKTILGLPIRDLTGGYKAYKRRVIEFLAKQHIESNGYVFLIETTARALADGYTYTEIPFTFVERRKGESKLDQSVIWEGFIKTLRLRNLLKSRRQGSNAHSAQT